MSMRSVTATGMETVSPGLSPCLGVAITDNLSYGQVRYLILITLPLPLADGV